MDLTPVLYSLLEQFIHNEAYYISLTEEYSQRKTYVVYLKKHLKTMIERANNLNQFSISNAEEIRKDEQLSLMNNVQFIYELVLAELELESLGAHFEVSNSLRRFRLISAKDEETLRKRVAYFESVKGKATEYCLLLEQNRTRSVNQYLTHWIYPYKGKFHPQMIRALLNIIGVERGDTVLDPYIGSGTTAVESQLLGINCIGVDVSPLCVLQGRVKTESIQVLQEIREWKEEVIAGAKPSLLNLEGKNIDDIINSIENEKVRNFYRMAKLVALSEKTRRRREFSKSFLKKLNVMIDSVSDFDLIVKELHLELGKIDIKEGDSRALRMKDETIDGIVTSPPYSIALDYVKNDEHAFEEMGYDLGEMREKFMGLRGKLKDRINLYNEDLKKSLAEMCRVLKPSKFAVIIIGNARYDGKEVKTVEFTIDRAEKLGLKLVRNIDKIVFGLYNVMQEESILIFEKF